MKADTVIFQPNKDGHLLLGNHFHELKDESTSTLETDNPEAFRAYLTGRDGFAVYFGENHCVAWPEKVTVNTKALASCALSASAPLALLMGSVGKDLGILDLEKLLTALRKNFLGSEVMDVFSRLKNFTTSKNLKYNRQVDQRGNYSLQIIRESATDDWKSPEKVAFKLPVFKFLPDTIEIELDFFFSLKEEDAKLAFQLQNLNLAEEIQDRRREVMESFLADGITAPKYWGKPAVHALNDAWRFKENAVK